MIYFGDGPVFWLSKLQSCTALSSTEAEFVASADTVFGVDPDITRKMLRERQKDYADSLAACQSTCGILALRSMLQELGLTQDKPSYLFTDNEG